MVAAALRRRCRTGAARPTSQLAFRTAEDRGSPPRPRPPGQRQTSADQALLGQRTGQPAASAGVTKVQPALNHPDSGKPQWTKRCSVSEPVSLPWPGSRESGRLPTAGAAPLRCRCRARQESLATRHAALTTAGRPPLQANWPLAQWTPQSRSCSELGYRQSALRRTQPGERRRSNTAAALRFGAHFRCGGFHFRGDLEMSAPVVQRARRVLRGREDLAE
ncbi:hypothetical protein NONI108955_25785 [Nocardia ninae]